MREAAACVHCTNVTCSVVVILAAIPDNARRLDRQKGSIEIDFPVCRQQVSILFKQIFLGEVTDDDLLAGYLVK
jgi:hypothetical protein